VWGLAPLAKCEASPTLGQCGLGYASHRCEALGYASRRCEALAFARPNAELAAVRIQRPRAFYLATTSLTLPVQVRFVRTSVLEPFALSITMSAICSDVLSLH